MRNTYTREKRTLCGESYMEVDLYAITPEEHRAKRRKKCRPSSERQKRRNAQHAHRRRVQKSNANFTVLGFYLTLTMRKNTCRKAWNKPKKTCGTTYAD